MIGQKISIGLPTQITHVLTKLKIAFYSAAKMQMPVNYHYGTNALIT